MRQKVGSVLCLVSLLCACNSETSQSINFSKFMPQSFEFCGQEITPESANYQSLLNWFKSNSNGWQKSPASYVPGQVFKSENMTVNIINNLVIVNYQSKGAWSQLVKKANTGGLVKPCK